MSNNTALIKDATVMRRDGLNRYLVIDVQCGLARLLCIDFHGNEDLGDAIICTHQGQAIWVALFHGWNFVEALA